MTSLEVSKQLYEVSGWKDTNRVYNFGVPGKSSISRFPHSKNYCPAYDTDWLLSKLRSHDVVKEVGMQIFIDGTSVHSEVRNEVRARIDDNLSTSATTPSDALALLAIKLFKQGILERE